MHFDRFDICKAWYLWLSHNHAGQSTTEYSRLCKMGEYFKPSPMLSYETLSENGQAIYNNISK